MSLGGKDGSRGYLYQTFASIFQALSIINVLIRDLLWADLPDSYDYVSLGNYRQQIFNYIYQTYPAA